MPAWLMSALPDHVLQSAPASTEGEISYPIKVRHQGAKWRPWLASQFSLRTAGGALTNAQVTLSRAEESQSAH